MLFRTLQTAMFALVVWLTFVLSQTNAQVSELRSATQNQQQSFTHSLSIAQQNNTEQLEQLDSQLQSISATASKNDESKKKLAAYQTEQSKKDTLQKAYVLVLEAEIARTQKDGKTAQARLKDSKQLIWKSGSNYPKHKKALQGLMQNIDVTLGAWKKQNLKKDTKAIYSVIANVIKSRSK